LLDGGHCYGNFWTTNYDHISLHTAWHGMPDDGGDNERYAMFKPRDELLDYFDRYAERHHLAELTHFGVTVSGIERDTTNVNHRWLVHTNSDDCRARFVVVATGHCRCPYSPRFENQENYTGELLHSKAYRNGEPFRGKSVLVVGTGNSGAEISTELVEAGAASVAMLGWGPRYYIPLDTFGELNIRAREMGGAGPEGLVNIHPLTPGTEPYLAGVEQFDAMLRPLAVDLTEFGIDLPAVGPISEFINTHRVPVMDKGAIPLMRNGKIEVIKDRVMAFTPGGVQLGASGERDFDAVILATGFTPGLEEFVPGELTAIVPTHGHLFPKTDGRCASTVYDDIYFVGFDQSLMSGLSIGVWGFEVGEKIATKLGTFSAHQRPPEFSRAPWEAAI